MPEAAPKASYTREEVRRLLNVSERQLKGWERHNLIAGTEQFAFSDLVALRTIRKLRASRVPAARIRDAVAALRSTLRGVREPLKELKVYSDGKHIRVEIEGRRMEPVSGQLLFNFDQEEIRRLLDFPGKNRPDDVRQRRMSAERWFQKGLQMEQQGSVEDAIEAYETAIGLDPTSAGALVNLGTIYFNARIWSKAETFYTRALEAEPEYPLAHFNMANLHDERGEQVKALKHYLEAVRLNPTYADAHYNLALLHQGSGQVMEAVRHWKLYLKLDPGSSWGAIARRELDKLRKSTLVHGSSKKKQRRS